MTRRERRKQRFRMALRASTNVNLISMMDILTVLLLFLLKSYVAGGEVMVPAPGIRLPGSNADVPPQASLVIAIDGREIVMGNEHVASVAEAIGSADPTLEPLASRLLADRKQQEEIARLGGRRPAPRRVTIQGDRAIEFRVLRKVMYTLQQSGYDDVSLAVLQKS